jgi:hypothetical protein
VKGSWRLIAAPVLAATFSAHAADDANTPLYYQDPSGTPFYAAGPKKTPDQSDYVPVFEDQPTAGSAAAAAPGGKRHILYYRNPMGLPDTSPVPKKIRWAWTTCPSMPTRTQRAMRAARCASARGASRRSA